MRFPIAGACVLAAVFILNDLQPAAAQDNPRLISVNYDGYHEFTETSPIGGHVDIGKVFATLGLVGEVGINHFNEKASDSATIITPAAGVRYLFSRPGSGSRIEPAIQVLVGVWHCGAGCGDVNETFIQPGFLLEVPRSPTFRIRVGVDVRRILFDLPENAVRVSAGAVWAF